jgi:hypothetical protein
VKRHLEVTEKLHVVVSDELSTLNRAKSVKSGKTRWRHYTGNGRGVIVVQGRNNIATRHAKVWKTVRCVTGLAASDQKLLLRQKPNVVEIEAATCRRFGGFM